MDSNSAKLKTMQSGKEIDLNTTLPFTINLRNALIQLTTGRKVGKEEPMTNNRKVLNQEEGLDEVIGALLGLIAWADGDVEIRSKIKWDKDNKNLKEEEKNDFDEIGKDVDEMKYDINKLRFWNRFLMDCNLQLETARKTANPQDDFVIKRNDGGEGTYELTANFREMTNELLYVVSQVKSILLINQVISAGLEEDEELTYKEQEQLFIESVREA